jgi:nitrite reductase/ring-hydroxylating ferredoxin subunit
MSRFPFPMPYGWFQIGYPDEVEVGSVKPLHYFGRDLVLWRDESGDFHVQDAFCPHLGAHLGFGGKVDGDQIACPFHGWQFDGAGACTNIPYSERLNKKAKLLTYPTMVRNGLLMVWYHPDGVEPLFEVPVLPEVEDAEFSEFYNSVFTVKTAIQEMAENVVDPAHFRYVHGTDQVAEIVSYEQNGPFAEMKSAQSYVTPRGVVIGEINASNCGAGFSYTWFHGIIDALLFGCAIPIDDDTVENRFSFKVRLGDNPKGAHSVAKAFTGMVNHQFTEDVVIWEHKEHLPTPALADTDGPVMKYRKWFAQFYDTKANASV